MQQLTATEIESAFVAAAQEQEGGPFNWTRVAVLLNERLADKSYERRARFLLGSDR